MHRPFAVTNDVQGNYPSIYEGGGERGKTGSGSPYKGGNGTCGSKPKRNESKEETGI
jgi:hypothetical protein